ncbi:tigger transposable element-derived protein 1, partial [Trichonephila clavipes]
VVDLTRAINLEAHSDGVQELLVSHNQNLAIDQFIDVHEQEQDIEELESLDPVQTENRMTVGNSTEGLSLIEKGLQILENTYSNEDRIFSTKEGIKIKLLVCDDEILDEKKGIYEPPVLLNLLQQGVKLSKANLDQTNED